MLGVKVSVVPCECIIRVVKVSIYYIDSQISDRIRLESGLAHPNYIHKVQTKHLYLFI